MDDVLLSDRFVYIHEPKTGGTFVTYVLTRLHGRLTDVRELRIVHPALRRRLPTACFHLDRLAGSVSSSEAGDGKYGTLYRWNHHGTCSEIPRDWRSHPIIATVRNPFETYVSEYLFGWWKRPEYLPRYQSAVRDFAQRYPDFPDLSFPQYLEVLHEAWTQAKSRDFYGAAGTGWLTERFVRFYFRSPWILRGTDRALSAALRRLGPGGDAGDMFPVRFLATARLNEELPRFLAECGYDSKELEFAGSLEHVLPVGGAEIGFADRAVSHDWRSLYTPDLMEVVRRNDRLIFRLFPEFDQPLEAAGREVSSP